jgi:hypothetical protein
MHDVGRHALIAYGQGGGLDVVGPDGVAHSICRRAEPDRFLDFFAPHRLHYTMAWRERFTKLEYLILNQDFGARPSSVVGVSSCIMWMFHTGRLRPWRSVWSALLPACHPRAAPAECKARIVHVPDRRL